MTDDHNAVRTPAQSVEWDPRAFAFSHNSTEINLIKMGFDHGLNRAYAEERRRADGYAKMVTALRKVARGKPFAKRAAELLRELGEAV